MLPEPDIADRRSRRDDADDAREAEAPGAQDLPARIVNAAIAIAEKRGRWSAVRLHDSRAGVSPMDENADVAEQINELLGAVAALKAYVAHLPGAADVDLEAVIRPRTSTTL